MSEQPLLYSVENYIATLTINRPEKRNALSAETIDLFLAALDSAGNDDDVRVVFITGAGEKAFCSGADLSGKPGGAGTSRYADLITRIYRFPKPTVAGVKGYCLAGGMGVMLACDIVIGRDDAQFGTPEVNVGLWPMMIGALIYRNMLPKHATPMIMLGERFGVDEAYRMGFVSMVVDSADYEDRIADVTAKLAQKSPIGMRLGKQAFAAVADMPFEEAVQYLSTQLTAVSETEDAKEGIAAFLEKRRPNFVGR